VPTDGSNLVAKALRLVGRLAAVHIEKRIPNGGGLGGGSADAAAVLRWAGHTDLVTAAGLGADVPFCLVGGRAWVTGVGEVVTPLPFEPRTVTLIVPPFGVSTPAAYAAWDELGGPTAEGPNDLEPAALIVDQRLRAWRDRIGDLAGEAPVLAGSGSTWFLPGERDSALAAVRGEGAVVVVARTIPG
jgi:4-diphosphocytidyl-2-C-methyl-D-erythritol kinase